MTCQLWITSVHRLRVIMLPLAAVLAGCSGLRGVADYKAPSEGPTARLRVATSFNQAEVFRMEPPECLSRNAALMARLGDWWTGKTPQQSLGIPLTAVGLPAGEFSIVGIKTKPAVREDAVSELQVPAGRSFGIRMQNETNAGFVSSSCELQFAFQPEPGGDYEAVFHFTPAGCRLELSRIVVREKDGPQRVEEPFTLVQDRCSR